jgi:hypothetical protein
MWVREIDARLMKMCIIGVGSIKGLKGRSFSGMIFGNVDAESDLLFKWDGLGGRGTVGGGT